MSTTAVMNGKQQTNELKSAPDARKTEGNEAPNPTRQIPEWLTAELFADLLQKNIPNFKCIKNFAVRPAQAAGENYATLMGLVTIDVELESGTSKQVSYMIKLPIESIQKLFAGHNIFDTERTMYSDVIPELEQMYGEVGVEVKFSPQYYDIETPSEFGVILMEDLRPRGFKNANRFQGFDMEHTKAALKKLAQWHAATAVRVETKGKYPEIVTVGIYTEGLIDAMENMDKTTPNAFYDSVPLYEGSELYMESLEKNRENFYKDFRAVMKADPNEFNVLNHGDFWANNIMFQYDAFGKIKETYFVDFQCERYGSPVNDLYCFLISSISLDVKLKHFDYFIKYYHDNLIECLKLLKYPKKLPALKDIHIALYKYGTWGLYELMGHMSIVLVDPSEAADVNNLMGNTPEGEEFKKSMYRNERFRKHAEAILPWLYNRGVF
ncbi:uncharacterized protein LOC105233495 isoform X1 [Bactrocera dorsalis]|uniref:Uncharacterized protein LOC105233495 isoform X1 n=1 Tax=Bactrocera dorsalis TaxID=27457 RepID=A0A6I9VN00_BACDO|nr:uncharacterized protein LOC105233495 isoform X1 [Bactrocera dorsalis]